MKRTMIIITLVLILSLVVTGCTTNNKKDIQPASDTSNTQDSSDKPEKTSSDTNEQNDLEVKPHSSDGKPQFTKANLSGEVVSISGNEIVLNIVEMPEPHRNTPHKNGGSGNSDQDQSDTAPPAQGEQGEASQDNNPLRQNQSGLSYIGESKTISIPDGISITTSGRGNDGEQQSTIKLEDIKEGDMLQIWYSSEEEETISKVAVMSFMKKQDDNK